MRKLQIRKLVISDFNYKIVRSNRRTLCIEVREGCVVVRSPYFLPQFVINKFLRERHGWISSKLKSMSQRQRIGDLFLGERVVISYQDLEKVQSGHISLKVLGQTELEKRRAREKFYKKNTIDFVNQFLAKHSEDFNFSEITFKAYRSKWGSCSADNNLNFNLYLSMCPTEVIEYIVVHELCHTRYKNHSRKFYKCVEQYLPDYKKPLDWLRRNRGLI